MKFNKIFSMFALGALAASMAACSDDEPQRGESPAVNNDGVYFATPATEIVPLVTDQTSFKVNIYREKADGELTVTLASTSDVADAPFKAPSSVTFAAGAKEAVIDITVDFAAVEANKKYNMQLSVGDAEGTPYALPTKNLVISYEPWSPWTRLDGYGTYTYTQYWSLEDNEVPVYVRQSLVDTNIVQYRCGDVGDESIPEADQYGMAYGVNYIFELNKATGAVTMQPTNTLYLNTKYNEYVYVADLYTYCKDVNPSFAGDYPVETFAKASYFDEETGMFNLDLAYYISAGVFAEGYEYLQLPGYTNYSVELALNGHWVEEDGTESQIVSIAMSEAVAQVKYEVYNGKLSEAQAQAQAEKIAADADAETVKSGGNISLMLTPGTYTMVAAGIDATGTYRTFAYITFDFESVKSDPNAGWTSKGMVTYTEDIMASLFKYPQVCSYQVEIQENDDQPGLYRLVNPYKEAWPYWDVYKDIANGKTGYLVINATDPTAVYLEPSPMNIILEGYNLVISSYAYELMQLGKSHDELKANGYFGTMVNGVITMPQPEKGPIVWGSDKSFYNVNTNGAFKVDFNGGGEEEESITIRTNAKKAANATAIQAVKQNMKRGFKSRMLGKDEMLKSLKARPGIKL